MGSKGDQTTQKIELPPEIEAAAIANLNVADEVGSIGHTPYRGPTVAGFSPQQIAAMRGVDAQAAAFNMPSTLGKSNGQGMTTDQIYTAMTGMPPPNSSAGGFSGYSGLPLMQESIERTPAAQRAAIESFVMDPYTGAPPTNLSIPAPLTQYQYNPQTGRIEAMAPPPEPMPDPAPWRPNPNRDAAGNIIYPGR